MLNYNLNKENASFRIKYGKKKVRGSYYGVAIEKDIAMKRGTRFIHLEVLYDQMTGKAIDKYRKRFNNFIAHLVRENVYPEYIFWKDVPQTTMDVIFQKLSVSFLTTFMISYN